jgi:hypothetical protein
VARDRQHRGLVRPIFFFFWWVVVFLFKPTQFTTPHTLWSRNFANVSNVLSTFTEDTTPTATAYMTGNAPTYSNTSQFYNIAPAPSGSTAYGASGFRADEATRNFFPEGMHPFFFIFFTKIANRFWPQPRVDSIYPFPF